MSRLSIFIDRLEEDSPIEINETVPPDFLEVKEQELHFTFPVKIHGKAYLSGELFVMEIEAVTEVLMPCSICNELFPVTIRTIDCSHASPTEEIPNHIFDFTEIVREALLIEIPLFAECHGGFCPEREKIASYLKKTEAPIKNPVHFPFRHL